MYLLRTYLKPYVTKHEDLFGAPKETNSDTLEQILKEKFLPKIISTLAERFKHKTIFLNIFFKISKLKKAFSRREEGPGGLKDFIRLVKRDHVRIDVYPKNLYVLLTLGTLKKMCSLLYLRGFMLRFCLITSLPQALFLWFRYPLPSNNYRTEFGTTHDITSFTVILTFKPIKKKKKRQINLFVSCRPYLQNTEGARFSMTRRTSTARPSGAGTYQSTSYPTSWLPTCATR